MHANMCISPSQLELRIHKLHLHRRVRPPPIKSPGYDTNGDLGNVEYAFIAITPSSTLLQSS